MERGKRWKPFIRRNGRREGKETLHKKELYRKKEKDVLHKKEWKEERDVSRE
jgi:hypothetical protein